VRFSKEIHNLNTDEILRFFAERAERYNSRSPDVSVLYSDSAPQLAKIKSEEEFRIVQPHLQLRKGVRVLDIGCGIGRWAELLRPIEPIYLGTDVSEDLIILARQRFEDRPKYKFHTARTCDLKTIIKQHEFDLVILSGLINYINDDEVCSLFDSVATGNRDVTVYIRAAHATGSQRLTLIQEWSEELQSIYSSIYRTVEETQSLISSSALGGFATVVVSWLYNEGSPLNFRSETRQYYWILRREVG